MSIPRHDFYLCTLYIRSLQHPVRRTYEMRQCNRSEFSANKIIIIMTHSSKVQQLNQSIQPMQCNLSYLNKYLWIRISITRKLIWPSHTSHRTSNQKHLGGKTRKSSPLRKQYWNNRKAIGLNRPTRVEKQYHDNVGSSVMCAMKL